MTDLVNATIGVRDRRPVGGVCVMSLCLLVVGLHASRVASGALMLGLGGLAMATYRVWLLRFSARLAIGIFAAVIGTSTWSGVAFDLVDGLQRYRSVIELLLGVAFMQRVVNRSDLHGFISTAVGHIGINWRRLGVGSLSAFLAFPLSLATVPLITAVVGPAVRPSRAAACISMRAVTLTMFLVPTTLASAAVSASLPGLQTFDVLRLGLPLFLIGGFSVCWGPLASSGYRPERRSGRKPLILCAAFWSMFALFLAAGAGVPGAVSLAGLALYLGEHLILLRSPRGFLNEVEKIAGRSFAEILLLVACGVLAAFVSQATAWPPLHGAVALLWGAPFVATAWVTIVLPILSMTGLHPMVMFSIIYPAVDSRLLGSVDVQYLAWISLFAYGQLLSPASISAILAASTLGVSPADASYRLHLRYVIAMSIATFFYITILQILTAR